jgi:hypothetical protein
MKKQSENYLTKVPIRNTAEYNEDDGKIVLLIPKFKHVTFLNRLIPKSKSRHFKIHLDDLGSQVWRLMDGTRTVQDICIHLAEYLDKNEKPSTQIEERVTKFLSGLYRDGFINFNEASHQSNE